VKALVLTEYNRFELQDVPRPEAGTGDVLVAVEVCGICGSDVHGMDGSTGRRQPPVVMGHEAAGVVAEVGDGVTDRAIGDRVTFDSTVYCGSCGYCRAGQVNLCDARRVLGVSCDEYRSDGAFAEYVAVPQRIVHRLPDAVTFEQAAMVEPLSVALHAVRRGALQPDDTAVVVGAGMIGLLIVQALRAEGCARVIAVDIEPRRLELASRLGADAVLHAGEADVAAEVMALTDGRGADVAIEAVGIPATVEASVYALRKGGRLVLVGNVTPRVALPLQAVVTRELTLSGSCASSGEYPACLDLLAAGAIEVQPLISAVAPLAEGAEWFARLHRADEGLMKVLLRP